MKIDIIEQVRQISMRDAEHIFPKKKKKDMLLKLYGSIMLPTHWLLFGDMI